VFGEDTPEDLIRALKPDIIFKGADYAGRDVPGAAAVASYGGEVELLTLLEGYSTTDTMTKVRGKP
jgi:D-beta-D-heptose 7-phosphate kinase / D-beta-D-heptose 1-phosphate adenosyltransferase